MMPVETTQVVGDKDKGEWWRGWIQVRYIWYIISTFVKAAMYPHETQ
jgi:hypothetical protein